MRKVCFLLMMTGLMMLPAVAQNQLYGTAPEEMKQFAFLEGEWVAEYEQILPDGNSFRQTGSWKGYYILDGSAFVDEFSMPVGNGLYYRGMTWRTYDPAKKHWVNRFTLANVTKTLGFGDGPFFGTFKDGVMELTMKGKDEKGPWLNKIRFQEIEANRFFWTLDRSYDNGETWKRQGSIKAVRKGSKS